MNTSSAWLEFRSEMMALKKGGIIEVCSVLRRNAAMRIDRHISGHRWYNKQEKIIEFICDPEELAQGVLQSSIRGYDKRAVDIIAVVFLYAFGDRSP